MAYRYQKWGSALLGTAAVPGTKYSVPSTAVACGRDALWCVERMPVPYRYHVLATGWQSSDTVAHSLRQCEHAAHVLDTLRRHALPLAAADGSNPRDVDAIVDAIGRRAHRPPRRGVARHARVLRDARRHHATADRDARLPRRRDRGRLARRASRRSVRARHRRRSRCRRRRSSGFRRFPQWMWRNTVVRDFVALAAPVERRARARRALRLLRTRSVQPARVDRRRAPLSRARRSEGGARARASATAASSTSAATIRRRTASPRRATLIEPCEDDVVRQLVELRHCADEYAASGGAFGEDDFFSAEQNARLVANAERYYRSMFHGRVVVVEPARHAHGRDARRRRRAPRARRRQGARRRLGAQLPPRRRARDADGAERGAQRRPARARAIRRGRRASSASRRTPARSPPRTTGTSRPSAASCAPDCAGSIEALFHASAIPNFLLDLRVACVHGRVRRAAPRARDRRDLSPGDRAAEPLLPRRPAAPVRPRRCTSTRRARSSRSSAAPAGSRGRSRRRRIRSRCEWRACARGSLAVSGLRVPELGQLRARSPHARRPAPPQSALRKPHPR